MISKQLAQELADFAKGVQEASQLVNEALAELDAMSIHRIEAARPSKTEWVSMDDIMGLDNTDTL